MPGTKVGDLLQQTGTPLQARSMSCSTVPSTVSGVTSVVTGSILMEIVADVPSAVPNRHELSRGSDGGLQIELRLRRRAARLQHIRQSCQAVVQALLG